MLLLSLVAHASVVSPGFGQGRGLKPAADAPTAARSAVSPGFGQGRGLKRSSQAVLSAGERLPWLRSGEGIETGYRLLGAIEPLAVSPGFGQGRGLKHIYPRGGGDRRQVSPGFGQGRGLKLVAAHDHRADPGSPLASVRGGD